MPKHINFVESLEVIMTSDEQFIEITATTLPGPSNDPPQPLNEVRSAFDRFQEGKYKAVIVEDDRQVREMVEQSLTFRGFECQAYSEAEMVLNDILTREQMSMPDVLLVDLELEHNKMQGLKLIERLTATDNPPPIIAMSAGLSNSELIEALKSGADDIVAKPFDIFQIAERIERLAKIGRKRRRYRQNPKKEEDKERLDRPVFLSYSFKDRRTASILRTLIEARGIDVWYASDILLPGDPITDRISKGLDRAQVFVPLVTDNYPRSAWCVFEMAWFRWSQVDKTRIVFPVLEGVVDRIRNRDLMMPIIPESEYADITFDRFADGLTALLGRIQEALKKNGHS